MLSFTSDKVKLFAKSFTKNSILKTQLSLYLFSHLGLICEMHNISITAKMVKKIIRGLESSKAAGPGCIPVVV